MWLTNAHREEEWLLLLMLMLMLLLLLLEEVYMRSQPFYGRLGDQTISEIAFGHVRRAPTMVIRTTLFLGGSVIGALG